MLALPRRSGLVNARSILMGRDKKYENSWAFFVLRPLMCIIHLRKATHPLHCLREERLDPLPSPISLPENICIQVHATVLVVVARCG